MYNDLPFDAVERVREIRNRRYEETKHMTREELREYNHKRYEEAKAWKASIKMEPNDYDFSWLRKK
jgi:vacuolar-type H+-ATPase subunit I/STV1